MSFIASLLTSPEFMPHGFCYMWDRSLIWLHLISDGVIALAYFSIPLTLLYFVRKKRDLPFHWMFLMFGLFIVACGSTHVMEVWNLWHADYWLAGIIKAITALASIITAILLFQLVPQALALPSPEKLEQVNQELLKRTDDLVRANAELKTANQALVQSEDRYRSLFGSNPLPAWVYDTETLAFLDVNPSAISHYGYSRDQFLVMTIKDIRPPQDVPAVLEAVASLAGNGEDSGVWRFRRHRKKDGTIFDVEGVSHPVVYAGRSARFVVALDVTERKRVEQELERRRSELARTNAELLATNKELEAFSYSVSHDLRAPLRSIDGFSLALLEDYEEKLDAEGKDSLHRVRAATQRMGVLIDDLLNLSRVTRAEIKLEWVDLSAIGRFIGTELQTSQPERRIELHIQEGLKAHADSNLMRIALENLLGNAWKFTAKREFARIEFGQTNNNGSRVYFVRDDGAGFDSARAHRLFGAFQRFHEKSDFPGTGVGLATVQRIIQRHGGRIWAESAVGKGATFYFTLLDARQGEPESWQTR